MENSKLHNIIDEHQIERPNKGQRRQHKRMFRMQQRRRHHNVIFWRSFRLSRIETGYISLPILHYQLLQNKECIPTFSGSFFTAIPTTSASHIFSHFSSFFPIIIIIGIVKAFIKISLVIPIFIICHSRVT